MTFVPFSDLQTDPTKTTVTPGVPFVVGTGPSLTVGVGQTVFGAVTSSVMFQPSMVSGFRAAIICAAPASEGTLVEAAAASADGGPSLMNFGKFAYQGFGGGSPASLSLPVLIQNLPPGTYNFGLCEEQPFSAQYSLVSVQGYFAVVNTSPSN
jgi:hypothetical protein